MDEQPLQILVVEDNPTDVFLLRKALAEVKTFKVELTQAKRLDEALQLLKDKNFDVVLLDLGLPDSQGLETFNRMQRDYSEIPILILSGLDDESLSVQAVQHGAQDFLVKGASSGKTLARTILYAIERNRSQQRLTASEAGYRRLFETAHEGIFILDAGNGQITDVNPFLEEMLGHPRAELIGKRLWEIAPFRDKTANQAAFRTLQEKGYIRYDDVPLATKSGQFIDVEFVSNIYEVGNHQVIQCSIRDITLRKRAEAAEQESKRFLQATIDALPAHLAVLDETGQIIAINQAWRQFSDENQGTAASCGVGANYLKVCKNASGQWAEESVEVSQGIEGVLKGQQDAFSLEYPCHSPTEERWFNLCVTPFGGEGPARVVVAHNNITERAIAENLVSVSEANLAKSQQMAHLGSWELDLSNLDDIDANSLRWSDELYRIFGYEPGQIEVSNEEFFRAVHPDDRATLSRIMAEAVAGGEPYSTEHRIILPDGRQRVVYAKAEIIYNEETGQPLKVIGLGQDITERKHAEEMLRRSETNLAIAQQMAHLGSWELDLSNLEDVNRNQLRWSDEAFRVFGYEPGQIESSNDIFFRAVHPDDHERVSKAVAQALRDGKSYHLDHRVLWPSGEERIVQEQAQIVFDERTGRPLKMVGTVQDITERKQAEEALQKNETKFRTIFETTLTAILLANDDGLYVDANPAACALLGVPHDQLMGRSIVDFVSTETHEVVRAAWRDFLREGQQSGEFEIQQPNGVKRQAEYRAVAGLLPGVHMAVMRDITERKLSEATLLESEARFRTAISEAPVPIMIHREDGKVLQISKGWTKYSGYDLEDIPTIRDWTDRAYGQASSEIYEYIKTLYSIEETRSGGERTVIAKNGHKRIWQFTATPLGAFGDDQRVIINTAFDVTESQQAEAEREAISREIVATWESMTDAFYSLDTQWNITRINSQAAQLIRCSVEELIGKSLWEQYPAALGLSFYTEFHRAVEEQVPVSFEEFFPPHNAWYEVHAYPSPNGLSVYFRDITERKQADAALRESEKRFKDIVANVPGMVYQFGRHVDGTISWPFVSNGCREMFEVEAESIKQNPSLPLDMIHPEDRDEFDRSMMAAKEALEPWSWQGRFRMPSGEIKWIEGAAHPQRLSDGGTLYTGLLMDFTARKQAETERDRFFTLSLDMLAITGSDGYFKRLNPAWEAILGFSNAELMAVPFLEFVHPDDIADTLAEMAKLSSGVRVMQFENRFRCHNGSYKWLRWMSAPFEESWYCVAHDITGVKETETALQQVNDDLEMRVKERTAELGAANESLRVENIEHQMTMATLREVAQALQKAKEEADIANAAKSEFLSRMSHELRTPLNAILGFGQILETQDLDPLANESIGFILSGGRHLLGLINEVLDIARVESGHIELSLEPIALNDIVPEACSLMRHLATDRHIGLGENTSKLGHVYVRADRQRLKQVLINLLANAIKYNRESGQVEVICQHRPDGWIDIAVRDTGPGIPPQDLSKLFTPFERLGAANSEIEGTGLGLVLSQRLVAVMGGTLKVESTLGLGTTFTVSLPQAIAPEKQLTNLREGNELKDGYSFDVEQPDQNTYTVLCIEDNPSNLRLMEAIFENRPEITLLTAIQGSIGLDLARQHEPDLILLDLNLPDIHGSEVLTRLRQSALTIDIPVVVISADATQNQIERLLTAGAMAYLTKPLDLSQFLRTLDEFLPRNLTVDPQPDMDEESTN